MPKVVSLADHLARARKTRWAKTTPQQRSEHARKMAKAGIEKRKAKKGTGKKK